MSISEKVTEIKKIIELVITVLPEVIGIIRELIVCLKDVKSV